MATRNRTNKREHNRMTALWKNFSEDQKRVYMNSFSFFALRVFPYWTRLNKRQRKDYAKTYAEWRMGWAGAPEGSPYTDGEWEVAIQYEWARHMEQMEASELYQAEIGPADNELYGSSSWRKYHEQLIARNDNPNMTGMN